MEKMNVKVSIIGTLPFEEMGKINSAMEKLGWGCVIADNGNFVFEKGSSDLDG